MCLTKGKVPQEMVAGGVAQGLSLRNTGTGLMKDCKGPVTPCAVIEKNSCYTIGVPNLHFTGQVNVRPESLSKVERSPKEMLSW